MSESQVPSWIKTVFLVAVVVAAAALVRAFLGIGQEAPPWPSRPLDETEQSVVQKLDAVFENHWQQKGVVPAPRASDLRLARRLSLGLTGTIPSLLDIRQFESSPDRTAVRRWSEHLLRDRRTADHLAERLARATVGVEGGPFIVYRRRRYVTWLSDQIAENRPYDRLVRDLITADGIWTTNPAVNFVTVTIDPNEDKGPDEAKLAARISRAFLGVRMDCVQCHDDQLGDAWLQKDFHRLASFFAGTHVTLTGVRDNRDPYRFKYLHAEQEAEVPTAVPFDDHLLDDGGLVSRRARLARWVTHPKNKAFARTAVNRIWALMFGRPLAEPIDEIPLHGPFPPGLSLLADDFASNGYDLHRLVRIIAASRVFGLDSRAEEGAEISPEQEAHWAAFPLTRLRPEQVAGAISQSSRLRTIDAEAHVLVRLARSIEQSEFVKRYGDIGEDEFVDRGGTIPQRLLMMNGNLVNEKTKPNILFNASARIAALAATDREAVEIAYLSILTRRPTGPEQAHFEQTLAGSKGNRRARLMQDLCWALINSTEFSWSH